MAGGSLYLYRLIEHHIDEHDAQGVHYEDCYRCVELARGHIKPRLLNRLRRHHHVMHELGLVWDGPGWPLQFEDMPAPDVAARRLARI